LATVWCLNGLSDCPFPNLKAALAEFIRDAGGHPIEGILADRGGINISPPHSRTMPDLVRNGTTVYIVGMTESAHPPSSAAWPDVSDAIRRTMRANKGKNTIPELALRSMVHGMGYRFRVHVRGLPGTPDIVFRSRCKIIWLHGCYWHGHAGCRFATVPKTRVDYWIPKLARNRERDVQHANRLTEMGWQSMVVWECEMKDLEAVRRGLRDFLGPTLFEPDTASEL
jgi:DNA mismatch endonuclease (patch repair protein)